MTVRVDWMRGIGNLVARLPKARAALAFAQRAHAGQRRSADGAPFVSHPIEVATLLYYAGAPDHVVAAGLLHDVIEKTDVEPSQVQREFGDQVARIVLAVSEDKAIFGYRARKAALRRRVGAAGGDALLVFAADKLAKVRELRLAPPQTPLSARARPRVRRRKLTHYRRSTELLEERLPESPIVAQLRSELDQLVATNGGATELVSAPRD